MASNQATRNQKEVIEKDRVPKMASHFESLTVSPTTTGGTEIHVQSIGGGEKPIAGNVGKFEMQKEEDKDFRSSSEMEGGNEISQYRQAAQQSSIDALRGAEERYNKAKDSLSQSGQKTSGYATEKGATAKNNLAQGGQKTSQVAAEKGAQTKESLMQGAQRTSQVAAEKGAQTKESLMQGAQKTSQVAAEKGAQTKESLIQGAQRTSQIAAEKGAQAKDSLMQGAQKTSQYATEKGGVLKDTALEKGQQGYATTKDTLASVGQSAAEYTGQAKDYVAEKAVGAKDYTGEKAAAVAETGKGTAGYVGSVATTVKDKAVVAGWGAAEFTADKVVGATKAVANVTAGAAGYVGQTAVAAKDKLGSAGVSAKDYAAQTIAAAKDTIVATEESAKDYAARKRAEAERQMQAKKSAESRGEVWSGSTEEKHDDIAGAGQKTIDATKETISKPVEKVGEFFQEQPEYGSEAKQGSGGGGVLHAIGETVVEIGQTTKELLVGKGGTQTTETIQESAEHKK